MGVWGRAGASLVALSIQGTFFGGILGDFGGACLTLGIHVTVRLQWGTGINFWGPGLAQWWLGDIACLRIPFSDVSSGLAGVFFPGSPGPPCIVGLH